MAVERIPALEEGPRNTLLFWGAGVLLLGLALVGVGGGPEGAPLALAGLFNVIYGIHTFGRLGPDDGEGNPALVKAQTVAWTGGLTALAGALVLIDHQFGWSGAAKAGSTWALFACAVLGVGALRLARGMRALREARVEKRPRMDKSRAP
jgi:hypothetical protein